MGKPFLSDIKTLRERARQHIEMGAVTPGYKADAATVIRVLNEALANMPQLVAPVFCPIFPKKTDLENDLETIMGRVSISTSISGFAGNVLNTLELFTVTATVKNCSTYDLVDAKLYATDTDYARVYTSSPEEIGTLGNGQVHSVNFRCLALSDPTSGTEPLVNLRLEATPVFSASISGVAEGEVVNS